MAETVTIRLRGVDRDTLEHEARERGQGLSTLLRDLAEAEAGRLRRLAIRADGQDVIDYLKNSPAARRELEDLGTPQVDEA